MWSRDQDGLDTVLDVGISSDTPPQGQVSKKGKKKRKKKDIGNKRKIFFILRRNKAKRVTMTKKRDQGKWFGKDVGCHVGCGNPYSCERAVVKVLVDKVVADIYMFGTRRNDVGIGNSTCTLVITIDWE